MRRRITSILTLGLAVAFFTACGNDNPTAPTSSLRAPSDSSSHSLLGLGILGSPQTVQPLHRTTALKSSLTASATVGLLGATLSIPGAGYTVIVPPLAAPLGTHLTVTALAGSNVAYEFAPHGLKFLLPLVATQDLKNTDARNGGLVNPLGLSLGYFPDANHVTTVTELLSVNINLLNQTAITTIWHFSGYIFASGRADDSNSDF